MMLKISSFLPFPSQSLALARIDFSHHSLFSLVNPLLCRGYYTEYQ